MIDANEIVAQALEEKQAEESEKATGALARTDEQPTAIQDVQGLTRMANDVITKRMKSGAATVHEAAVDMVKAAATVKAATDNADEYAEIAGEALTHEMKADTAEARSKERKAGNVDNEAFYERFRPILEFDFGNITGNPKKRAEDAESKSYSKFFMLLTIAVAALPWLIVALVLYVLKGINAIVELIRQFTKIAQAFIWTGLGALLVYALLKVIAHYVEFYTGVQILPF